MTPVRLIVETPNGDVRAQLLDSPELSLIRSGRWDCAMLIEALESVRAPGRHVLTIAIQSSLRSLRQVSGPVKVRRVLASEGRLPRRLRRGNTNLPT